MPPDNVCNHPDGTPIHSIGSLMAGSQHGDDCGGGRGRCRTCCPSCRAEDRAKEPVAAPGPRTIPVPNARG